jgi:5-methylcytosine-specific restriction endonuclease McrA
VIVGLYSKVEYRRRCGELEVDHEIPLWKIWHLPDDERRPYYGPDNLRLRCKTCHKAKSKREAAERASLKTRGPVDLDAAG